LRGGTTWQSARMEHNQKKLFMQESSL